MDDVTAISSRATFPTSPEDGAASGGCDNLKSVDFKFRVTPRERALITRCARAAGCSNDSEWGRDRSTTIGDTDRSADRALAQAMTHFSYQLQKIGVNVNQISHAANYLVAAGRADEMINLIDRMKDVLHAIDESAKKATFHFARIADERERGVAK
ncbi:plasmid mobilization protein [Gimibacter soli]|uniref:Plasmid mobilization relaxosome protein MobC n=1 Tax=Gimibacter soli TaxID=3024400 RepID=A0AAE9XNS4_9PROT|nr:plasmid mobilization relaxosome protein MobC [Gimibacter soli]WCL54417.1 plasmid mobilization relaxosome protein MobC [Gimibacter soli]